MLLEFDEYILKVYHDNIFLGYIKRYEKYRDGKFIFYITKKIERALYHLTIVDCDILKCKLDSFKDVLIYDDNYIFEVFKINNQEIRKLKLTKIENG